MSCPLHRVLLRHRADHGRAGTTAGTADTAGSPGRFQASQHRASGELIPKATHSHQIASHLPTMSEPVSDLEVSWSPGRRAFRSVTVGCTSWLACDTFTFQKHSISVQRERVMAHVPTHNWASEGTGGSFTVEILCFWAHAPWATWTFEASLSPGMTPAPRFCTSSRRLIVRPGNHPASTP